MEAIAITLFQAQQPLYEIRVRTFNDAFLGEVAFAFLGLFGENVPFEGLLVGDLAGAGYFEPFLCTGVRFDLGHFRMLLMFTLLADAHWRITYGAVWAIGSAKVRKINEKSHESIRLGGFFVARRGNLLSRRAGGPSKILSFWLFVLLFLRLRRPDRQHPLAFHLRHAFQHTGFIEALGEF